MVVENMINFNPILRKSFDDLLKENFNIKDFGF